MRNILRTHWRLRRILVASARVELRKRYAGSLLGPAWTVLYPLLFLGMYLFLWLVVFPLRVRTGGALPYVAYVFAGLVPFLYAVESVTTASVVVRQNMHLVKGVILPLELLPTRAVLVAFVAHAVALTLAIVVAAAAGTLTWRLAWLPVIVAIQLIGTVGLCWGVAVVSALVPDLTYLINLSATLLMFVSPIAFTADMVPARWQFLLWLNPVTYVTAAYRLALGTGASVGPVLVFGALSILMFVGGARLCARLKSVVVDFE